MLRDFRGSGLIGRFLLVGALCLPASAGAAAKWWVVHGEFFDVYTDAGKDEALDTAVWMEQFRRTVGTIWKVEPRTIRRATIVQFRSDEEFSKYRDARFLGGYFTRSDYWATMAFGSDWDQDSVRQLVQHECVHWLMAAKRARFPLWLDEGFAELFSTVAVEGRQCSVFAPVPWNVDWLQRRGAASLRRVLGTRSENLNFNNETEVHAFYAQAWVLVHYLLRGRGVKDGAGRLQSYLNLLDRGSGIDEAFREAFGVEPAQLQEELSRYVVSGSYSPARVPFVRSEIDRAFKVEPAPEVEVQCALATLELAGLRDPLAAAVRFRAARDRFPDSPLPYEGLGYVACVKGDFHVAVPLFNEALTRGSRTPFVRYLPASSELQDQLGGNPRTYAMPAADARRLCDALRTVLEQEPTLTNGPDEFGLALQFTDPVQVEDVKFLASLARYTAEPGIVFYRTTGLLHLGGQDEEVRKILGKIAETSGNPRLKEAAERDLAELDAPASEIRIGARPVQWLRRQTMETPLRLP